MEDLLLLNSSEWLIKLIEALVIMVGAFALFFGLNHWLLSLSKRANLPALAFNPVRIVLRFSILALAICLILSRFGVPVNGIIAMMATGLAMVAIGFVAVWSVLSNFLCTFVLIIFKPFSVGDEIEFPTEQISGKVVDLTLMFTTLRYGEGEYFKIPNNMFFQKMFKVRTGKTVVELDEQLRKVKPLD